MVKKAKKKASKKTAPADDQNYDTEPDTGEVVVEKVQAPHGIDPDKWAKLSGAAQKRYFAVYNAMTKSPSSFNCHPKAEAWPDEWWTVVATNAAWAAACA